MLWTRRITRLPRHLTPAFLTLLALATTLLPASAAPPMPAPGFIENHGQQRGPAAYYVDAGDCAAWFEPHAVVIDHAPRATGERGVALRVSFPAQRGDSRLEAGSAREERVNVFSGTDPSRWRAAVPTYESVRYRGIARGADLVYRLQDGRLKYDLELAPGADLSRARLRYEGAERLEVDADGALLVHTAAGVLREEPPFLYQEVAGQRVPVSGGYRVHGTNVLGFVASSYDHDRTLVVDPGVAWSTYLGGDAADDAYALATTSTGDVIVVGSTASTNYPVSSGAYQRSKGPGVDVVVTKIRADGGAILWSTHLGGDADDIGRGVAVDGSGNVYVTGQTASTNFPVSSSAYQRAKAAGVVDGFVTKLNATGGSLVYSTYLGGGWDDYPRGIAVDASGAATVAGFTNSLDWPTTAGVVKSTRNPSLFDGADGFVTKLNAAGSGIVYSTYLGSNGGTDEIMAVALDASGRATVTGWTVSTGFPTTANAYDRTADGYQEAFVTRLNATGTGYVFSTFLGGTGYDEAYAIDVGPNDDTWVVGRTTSPNFPTTSGAYRTSFTGGNYYDAFVTRLAASGSSLVFSTFVAGAANDMAYGLAVSGSGYAAVTGITESTNFPVTSGAVRSGSSGGMDAFAFALNPTGSQLTYSTYLGGSLSEMGYAVAIKPNNNQVVVAGGTASSNFPTLNAIDATQNSANVDDIFVGSFDMGITSGSLDVTEIPFVMSLARPQPNPFRSQMTLEFTLERAMRVEARVIDVQGREVVHLLDQVLGAGRHPLIWDGRDASGRDVEPGVYRLEFATPEGRTSRPVVRLH